MSKIEVDAIDKQSGSTLTLGGSGTAVTLACGATQSGFGRTGTVDWQTSIKTAATFSASNGEGYFVDTSSNAVTANLPAGSVGAIVAFKDYAQNFDTNALTISANGSDKIEGQAFDKVLNTEGIAVTAIYGDATKGWQFVNSNEVTNQKKFVTATGGTITTVCTNFKVHTFTGPGTFQVTCAGTADGSNTVSYMVVAGGGGAGAGYGGGGGGGGFRESRASDDSYTASPLNNTSGPAFDLEVPVTSYPITVGAGGNGASTNTAGDATRGGNSIFSTITSTGGGTGGNSPNPTRDGGSGGGGSVSGGVVPGAPGIAAGSGNTPPVSPPQGTNGGVGYCGSKYRSGGGGGATVAGLPSPNGDSGGGGGTGATTSISSSPTSFSGGGGGGQYSGHPGGGAASPCGTGKAASAVQGAGPAASANTGGGGGGGAGNTSPGQNGGNGGSGIVVIRYKFQD
jgi:hypothetical protein